MCCSVFKLSSLLNLWQGEKNLANYKTLHISWRTGHDNFSLHFMSNEYELALANTEQKTTVHTEGCIVSVELGCYFCVLQGGLNTSK